MQSLFDQRYAEGGKLQTGSLTEKSNKFFSTLFELLFKASLLLTIFLLLLIAVYISINGFKLFQSINPSNFFLGTDWEPVGQKKFGILPMIISSFYVTIASLLISTPIGIGCAIYAAELADERFKKIIQAAVQILAGTPSVVFGWIGLSVIVPWIQTLAQVFGLSILAAIIILSVMILPTIVSISQDVIQSVPKDLKQASLALGATHYQTITKVILPVAKPGLITAVVLAMSRAFGEAMAVKMVIGNIQTMPNFSSNYWFGLLSPARTLTTNIIGDIDYAREGAHLESLFATGIVLFIVIMMVNYLAYLLRGKSSVKKANRYIAFSRGKKK